MPPFCDWIGISKKFSNLQLCLHEEEEDEYGLGEFGLRDPRGDAVDADLQVLKKCRIFFQARGSSLKAKLLNGKSSRISKQQ